MEKIQQQNENSFLRRLQTPLGFGIAILVSAGIGFGLSILQHRLKEGSLPEYQKLIREIKELLEEQKGETTYSDQLIKLVYECAPLIAQEDYSSASSKAKADRIATVDDLEKYNKVSVAYAEHLVVVTEKAFSQIIKDAGGFPNHFIQVERDRKPRVQSVMDSYQNMMMRLKLKSNLIPSKHKITPEAIKEMQRYELELLEEIKTKNLISKMTMPFVIIIWITDKLYQKFGINMETPEYKDLYNDLLKTDPEVIELSKKIGAGISGVLRGNQ